MKGSSSVSFSGNVGGILFSETKTGDKVCNFIVYCEDSKDKSIKAKVNAYGEIANTIQKLCEKGDYIVFTNAKMINRELKFSEDISVELKLTENPIIFKKDSTNPSKCINSISMSGNVGSIMFSNTRSGDRVCNFILYIEEIANRPSKLRVNAYGEIANIIERFAERGDYISISNAKIINRDLKSSDDVSTEIKLSENPIIIKRQKREEEYEGEGN